MRPCRLNPKLSSFEALEGIFHFTSTPFAPPGTKVLAHKNPVRRASWGFHANKGWYIGPVLNHYQCYKYITKSTGAERITDTIKFQYHDVKVPQPTAADRITSAARELQRAIKQQPAKSPMEELQAIKRLRQVLLGQKPLKLTTKPTLTTATQQSSPKIHSTKSRVVNRDIIGSKHNSIKSASRKRVQQLIDAQLRKYPSPAITPTYEPIDDSPDLAYISDDSDSDSDSASDDNSVAPFLNLSDDEDEPYPAPRYNFHSNRTFTSVNAAVSDAVQEAIRKFQLEVNPKIIPPLVIKEESHLT